MQPEDVGDQILRGHDDNILRGQFGDEGQQNLNQEVVHHIQLHQDFPQQGPNPFDVDMLLIREGLDLFEQGRFKEGWAKLMTGYVRRRGFGQQIYVWEHCLIAVLIIFFVIFFMSIQLWFCVMRDAFKETGIFREVAAFPGFVVQSMILLTHFMQLVTRFIFR